MSGRILKKWGVILVKLGNTAIDFSIFRRRSLAIAAIVALLIISTQLLLSCINNDDSIQHLKLAGSCHHETSILLIDESDKVVEKDSFPKLYKVRRKLFKQYAVNISQYLFAKIDAMDRCQGGWMRDPEVELVFVYRPLVGEAKFSSDSHFNQRKSPGTKILDSPWVKMSIDKSSKLFVRAVFFWNERQFLFDQAVLSGVRPTAAKQPLMPLKLKVLGSYYEAYYYTELILPSKDLADGPFSTTIPYEKTKATALLTISKQMPKDIRWLFTTLQWSSEYDVVHEAFDNALRQHKTQHHELTKSLLNPRLSSIQTEQRYNNILDLKPIFNVDTYRYISR